MLIRLIRYECKALMRILPALYLGLQVLATAAGLNNLAGPGIAGMVAKAMWGLVCIAVVVMNFVIVILRFRDNFLKDEGYLMFTLPVQPWELIASKAAAALLSILLSAVALVLSRLIYGLITNFRMELEDVTRLLRYVRGMDSRYLTWTYGIVLVLVGIFQQLCLIYTSLIVSRLVPRFRGLVGFGVFLAVWIILESPLSSAASSFLMTQPDIIQYPALMLLEAAFAALYFWAACLLLKRHFNLE